MGTHPSGPSFVEETKIPLSEWLRQNPAAVGYVPPGYPSDSLPFLLKVLSIRTALSIQVTNLPISPL
jgi:mannose-6-phosphate isomerase